MQKRLRGEASYSCEVSVMMDICDDDNFVTCGPLVFGCWKASLITATVVVVVVVLVVVTVFEKCLRLC